jgi:hypothetical protein
MQIDSQADCITDCDHCHTAPVGSRFGGVVLSSAQVAELRAGGYAGCPVGMTAEEKKAVRALLGFHRRKGGRR